MVLVLRHRLSGQRKGRFHRLVFPSLCCLLPTSVVIPSRTILPMA